MKAINTVILFLVALSAAFSYPISPRPLRKLMLESEYIIVGYVRDIRSIKESKDSWVDAIADIDVKEVLYGNLSKTSVEVGYSPGFICPAPPYYEKGATVIVFLTKSKKWFETVALSYGVKDVDAPGIEAYKARINEMKEIMILPEGLDKFTQTVEWLVKCVEHPATRWEGSYELSPSSDFMSYYDRTEHTPFQSLLSEDHQARLKTVLLADSEKGLLDFGLVDLVYPRNEKEVHALLLRQLKSLTPRQLWYAGGYMKRLTLITNDPALESLVSKFEKASFDRNEEKQQQKIVNEFVALLEKDK